MRYLFLLLLTCSLKTYACTGTPMKPSPMDNQLPILEKILPFSIEHRYLRLLNNGTLHIKAILDIDKSGRVTKIRSVLPEINGTSAENLARVIMNAKFTPRLINGKAFDVIEQTIEFDVQARPMPKFEYTPEINFD